MGTMGVIYAGLICLTTMFPPKQRDVGEFDPTNTKEIIRHYDFDNGGRLDSQELGAMFRMYSLQMRDGYGR